jgi:hypothetical protein
MPVILATQEERDENLKNKLKQKDWSALKCRVLA